MRTDRVRGLRTTLVVLAMCLGVFLGCAEKRKPPALPVFTPLPAVEWSRITVDADGCAHLYCVKKDDKGAPVLGPDGKPEWVEVKPIPPGTSALIPAEAQKLIKREASRDLREAALTTLAKSLGATEQK